MTAELPPRKTSVRERLAAIVRQLRGGALTPGRAAASIGIGLFVGMIPLVGFQLAFVLAICVPLRLDSAVAYLASHVSNPLTLPFLVALELEIGSLILTGQHAPHTLVELKELRAWSAIGQVTMGSLILGSASGVVGSVIVWVVGQRIRDARARARAAAKARTIARYAFEDRPVRYYVTAKLRTDPSFATIADLGPLGRVVDVGSGYGQLALCLLELGRATSVFGIDVDEKRVKVARRVAGSHAEFVVGTADTHEIPEADTVLFVDALHYLPLASQDAALARAARALTPGGRIVIREVEVQPSARSFLTRYLERQAVRRTRGIEPGFRSSVDLARALEGLGLVTQIRVPEEWSLFDDVLVVGRKPDAPGGTEMGESAGAPGRGP